MIRGTTPTIEFTLPFDAELLAAAFLTISQRSTVIIEKQLEEFICNGTEVKIVLSQEETLKLDDINAVEVQVRCRMKDGKVIASKIASERVDRILKDGVI